MTADRNPVRDPTAPLSEHRSLQGTTRGIVWSDVVAEMRADAAASGDDRFDRLDALVRERRVDELRALVPERPDRPFEAEPIDLERVRAQRAAADADRAA